MERIQWLGVRTCSLNTSFLLNKKLLRATGSITLGLRPLHFVILEAHSGVHGNHSTEFLGEMPGNL